ncbi:DUF2550 family protein [Cellulomonas sp. APG4]|nr:DUF2550 domain-containing protein [Cellulomonas sp. APG4]NCT90687.1 DUF2550 family protein [Cellulomonas sp. APG4]
MIGLLLAVLLLVGLFLSRQRTLSQRVGSFACSLRPAGTGEAAWTPGIAQYTTGRLVWWRTLSLAPRPAHGWSRAELTLVERVRLDEVDHAGQQVLLVRCCHGSETFELSMSDAACAGLVSWLESGPRPVGRVI